MLIEIENKNITIDNNIILFENIKSIYMQHILLRNFPKFIIKTKDNKKYKYRLNRGDTVTAGQILGTIMKMKGINNTMLHLEMYSNQSNGNLSNSSLPYKRRDDLVNPTNFINSLRSN